jgi:hypothetical protein
VSEATLTLLRDVFEQPALFRNLHTVRKRSVLWGRDASLAVLEHHAAVISERELLENLGLTERPDEEEVHTPHGAAGLTIFASRPLPEGVTEHRFGSRFAALTRVVVKNEFRESCSVESLKDGWLFLIPHSSNGGILFAVGAGTQSLLSGSRLIAEQISELREIAGEFPCSPRIASPLAGAGWLACGAAAMAFDPICGDGTGNAVREAVLASAVVRAALAGEPLPQLFQHYESRLTAGFLRHLMMSREFYRTGHGGSWWGQELAALDQGVSWCTERHAAAAFHYRLSGFDLQPIR